MYKRRICEIYDFFWRRQSIQFGAGESSAKEITSFGDGRATLQFLLQFKNDYYAIGALRGLLSESRRWIDASRFTGDQVLAEVARLILSGELGVAVSPRSYFVGSSSIQQAGAPAPMPAGAPLSATKSDEPEPATFPSSLNSATQAAALSAAAASGAPFCPH